MDDHALHIAKRSDDVVLVRVGLHGVFAHDVHALEVARQRRIEHVRQPQSRLAVEPDVPLGLEARAGRIVGDEAIAAEDVRPATQATAALHVALAAQRVHPDAFTAVHAAGERQVAEAHHARRTLRVLGDAEAVVDRAARTRRVDSRGLADVFRIYAGDRTDGIRGVVVAADKLGPDFELPPLATRFDELRIVPILAHDDVRDAVENRDVRSGAEREVDVGAAVRAVYRLGPARVDDDELRALADAAFHHRAEDGMAFGGIRADDHDDVGLQHRIEVLARGACPHRG